MYGQLAYDSGVNYNTPQEQEIVRPLSIVQAFCGRTHTMLLSSMYCCSCPPSPVLEDGELFAFGSGEFGQLGRDEFTTHSVALPIRIEVFENLRQRYNLRQKEKGYATVSSASSSAPSTLFITIISVTT